MLDVLQMREHLIVVGLLVTTWLEYAAVLTIGLMVLRVVRRRG